MSVKSKTVILNDDGLPMFLCRECLSALNKAHQFKEQCLQSDTLLKTQLKDLKQDSEKSSIHQDYHSPASNREYNSTNIKKENKEDDDDLYVLVVNKSENDLAKQNSDIDYDFSLKSESYDETEEITIVENKVFLDEENKKSYEDGIEINLEEPKMVLPQIVESHSSKSSEELKNSTFSNSNVKELELSSSLNVSDEIHNSKFNVIPLWKIQSEEVNTPLIELDNCNSPLALTSEITMDDTVAYTQEEIEVENTDENYEIISQLDVNTLPKKNMPIAIIQQDGTFLCDCGETFKELPTYEQHVATHSKLTCTVCGKGFESKEVITGHMLLHERSDSHLPCPFCQKVMRRNLLTVHINTHHGPNRPTCPICRKTFATEHNRKRHMLIHLNSKDFECDICHIKFNHKIAMQNHRLLHEKSYELRCQNCFKEFSTESELKGHENESCGLAEQIDTNQKHICTKCGKTYSSQSSLQTHIEFVHGFEHTTLLCAECGETFSDKKAMFAHSYIHRQNRPKNNKKFVCNVCNKTFVSLAMLLMHERVHTNERPYKCNKCTFAFKTKTHLSTHQLTHTQEKRFGCSVCMKFFALKGNLIVHLRTHTGERPYVCNICSQAFIDSKYLKKHKLRRHGMEVVMWE